MQNEEYDLRINSGAVDAQLEWAGEGHLAVKKKPVREDMEAFETAYNAACGSISRGEWGQGEVLLKRAKGERGYLGEYRVDANAEQIYVMPWRTLRKRRRRQSYCRLLCSRFMS